MMRAKADRKVMTLFKSMTGKDFAGV